jgi:hypothetical protein
MTGIGPIEAQVPLVRDWFDSTARRSRHPMGAAIHYIRVPESALTAGLLPTLLFPVQ